MEVEESRGKAFATINIGVSAFPTKLFEEWKKDCGERFGDCRWLKIWNDHMVSKIYVNLIERINELERKVSIKEQEKTEEVKTFKGTIKEK
jgi:hypothetical protein